MSLETYTNAEFLGLYLDGQKQNALLPIDEQLIQARFDQYEERFRELVREKTIVAEQSGDNWHDGAFRATDDAAGNLAEQVTLLNRALTFPRVGYPSSTETFVTLGSRVELQNKSGVPYVLDIVGLSTVHDRKSDEPEVTSLESPIAKAVVGKQVGQIALMNRGGSDVEITVVSIDQVSLKGMYSHGADTK